ncbi:MAG: ImmA/IrrE family metallo-endopeptidase [Anaerolineae bacterium]|nr:ImmA/IrrE family metallo-endopeptidase [Anaerolineae bacterium]
MKLESAFKRRCEAIAVDWRYRLGRWPFDPLPAEALLNALQGRAATPDELLHILPGVSQDAIRCLAEQADWSAGIIRRTPLLIVYHPAHAPTRRQADLMHELAHVLLDHPMIGFHPETRLPVRNAVHEDEATYLGSCLQIPRLGLRWAADHGYSVVDTARRFGSSEAVVRFRSNMTGIRFRSFAESGNRPS